MLFLYKIDGNENMNVMQFYLSWLRTDFVKCFYFEFCVFGRYIVISGRSATVLFCWHIVEVRNGLHVLIVNVRDFIEVLESRTLNNNMSRNLDFRKITESSTPAI